MVPRGFVRSRCRTVTENHAIETRIATPDDREAFRALGRTAWRDSHASLVPDAHVQRVLERFWTWTAVDETLESDDHVVAMAFRGDEPVGFAGAHVMERDDPLLYQLYAVSDVDGETVRRALLEAVISAFPPTVETIRAEYLHGDEILDSLYESLGFTVVEDRPYEYDEYTITVRFVERERQVGDE